MHNEFYNFCFIMDPTLSLTRVHSRFTNLIIFQQSFCSVDEDCPSFGRTRCKGLSLGLCLTGWMISKVGLLSIFT